jgi:hypothetical protein
MAGHWTRRPVTVTPIIENLELPHYPARAPGTLHSPPNPGEVLVEALPNASIQLLVLRAYGLRVAANGAAPPGAEA